MPYTPTLPSVSTPARRPAYQHASLLTNPVTQRTAAIQAINKLRKAPHASPVERRQIARDLVGQLGHVSTRLTLAGACKLLSNIGVPSGLLAFFQDDSMVDAIATTVESWGRALVRTPVSPANVTAGLASNATGQAAALQPPAKRRFALASYVPMFRASPSTLEGA